MRKNIWGYLHHMTSQFTKQIGLILQRINRRFESGHTTEFTRLIDGSSVTEKIIFFILVLTLAVSTTLMLFEINEKMSVIQPAPGGNFTEGVVGSPRFINPLLAVSDADKDMVSLVYSGLLKRLPSGELAYDLADSITISDDATVFTVTIKEDAVFHDGTPVTARDVAFTVEQAKNPQLRSPVQGDWVGVNVSIIDEHEVQFELDEPYAPFTQNLTLGILPAHIWSSLSASQFPSSPRNDATPIGSGPYKVTHFSRHQQTALAEYRLRAFEDYVFGRPYISSIRIQSFADEASLLEAIRDGSVDSAGGIDTDAAVSLSADGHPIETASLPRMFGVFFNQNENNAFTSRSFREALSVAIDKQQLIDTVLNGYAAEINDPSPKELVPSVPETSARATSSNASEQTVSTSSLNRAKTILKDAGYTQNDEGQLTDEDDGVVTITLSTADTPELTATATILEETWGKLGINVTTKIFPASDLNQDVIRSRNYEALLFGEVIGPARDFFPFWHSSQQSDPGINIAQYANIEADELLEEARQTPSREEQNTIYRNFLEIVADEQPAVFLYTPSFIYAAPPHVKNISIGPLNTSHNRFALIHQWYVNTAGVWLPFSKEISSRNPTPITHSF